MKTRKRRVVVIGGGFGGLSAAALLAHCGHEVELFERAPQLGGKAGIAQAQGADFDTGPSLLTMPRAAEDLFERCGQRFSDHVRLRRLSPAFHYMWPDGMALDIDHDLEVTLANVQETLGRSAASELEAFMEYARQIWDASAPAFVLGDAPSFGGMLRLNVKTLASLRHIDASNTMETAICKRVQNPYLRDLLRRYATYNGSDVRRAPATLNCIAWVEMGLGGYGVEGGIGALVRAIVKLCEEGAVQLHTSANVDGIINDNGRAVGIEVNGRVVKADAVICNADVEHLRHSLLPLASRPTPHPHAPSMSGWNMVIRVPRGQASCRFPHTVLFPDTYIDEFAAIFDRGQICASPTIYACNQQLSHARRGWSDADALFVMVNAPSVGQITTPIDFTALAGSVMKRLRAQGLVSAASDIVWTRDPHGLAERFPGSQGALYGAASNSIFSAFRRPANRSKVLRGLYLAGGSAHPGGGVPLCILSGLAAGRAMMADVDLGAA